VESFQEEDNSLAMALLEKTYKTILRDYPVLPLIEYIQEVEKDSSKLLRSIKK